jgi:hypothetical protein
MVVGGMVLSGKIDWQINKFCFKTDVMFVLRIVFGLDTYKRLQKLMIANTHLKSKSDKKFKNL